LYRFLSQLSGQEWFVAKRPKEAEGQNCLKPAVGDRLYLGIGQNREKNWQGPRRHAVEICDSCAYYG
jgi:hypothetical protein